KPDFIGKRSLAMADMTREGRKQLVGLLPEAVDVKLDEGAQIVVGEKPATGTSAIGHVTSSYWSPTLQRGFAMALVQAGLSRLGARVQVTKMDGTRRAQIVEPIFYDKEGKRLDA